MRLYFICFVVIQTEILKILDGLILDKLNRKLTEGFGENSLENKDSAETSLII